MKWESVKGFLIVTWGIIMWFAMTIGILFLLPERTWTPRRAEDSVPITLRNYQVIKDGRIVCYDPVMDADNRIIECN